MLGAAFGFLAQDGHFETCPLHFNYQLLLIK
jgi:hypothetical protein